MWHPWVWMPKRSLERSYGTSYGKISDRPRGETLRIALLLPARCSARLERNATYFSRNGTSAFIVGQDSSPAAGVHAGLFALLYTDSVAGSAGPGGPAQTWRSAPHLCRIQIAGSVCGITLGACCCRHQLSRQLDHRITAIVLLAGCKSDPVLDHKQPGNRGPSHFR
jgi:hypothetical protein